MQLRQPDAVADLRPVIDAATGARLARLLLTLDDDDAAFLLAQLRPAARRVLHLARRDVAIRATVQRFWPDLTITRQAIELSLALRRYAAAGWRRDRTSGGPPAQPFARALYQLLEFGGGRTLGHRRLITILTDEIRVMQRATPAISAQSRYAGRHERCTPSFSD